jgi:putative ATP-dependent endonuclease of OLD family
VVCSISLKRFYNAQTAAAELQILVENEGETCYQLFAMILKRAHITNFRSLRDVSVSFEMQTAILGGNGAGKSTILKALERFYGPSTSVSLDDFFGNNVEQSIEIALTFTAFNDAEHETFGSRIVNDELNVVRVFDAKGGKASGRYYGFVRGHAAFDEVRALDKALAKRSAYKELKNSDPELYRDLEDVAKAEEIDAQLVQWENQHPERCQPIRDDGQFLGFTNVAKGSLNKFTNFVFIPAVRDAAADAIDGRGSAIARLMELVVKSAVQRRRDFQQWQEKMSTEYRQLVSPDNLTELKGLANDLTESLQILYEDTAVSLEWQSPADFVIPLPAAEVSLEDGGFPSSVEKQGNGLQRAFILTLLQHLARATVLSGQNSPENEDKLERDAAVSPLLPGLILAIEEPELYQHPTKQRHFARVLSLLSDGSLPGVAAKMQIAFASHSPYFICMDRFDEVRLAKRHPVENVKHKECILRESSLRKVCKLLESAHGKPEGTYSEAGLRSRLHIITSEVAEGFFADVVVLVEGESDRAALKAIAAVKNVDFEAMGIAVLSVNGKNNLDRPAAIFMSLEIPVFVIWDSDNANGKIEGEAANRALQQLLKFPDDRIVPAGTLIVDNFACFEWKLEKTLVEELGAQEFEKSLSEAMQAFAVERKEDAIKAPAIMKHTLGQLAENNKTSKSLEAILHNICAMKQKSLVMVQQSIERGESEVVH